ncbi:MAG: transglutaminase domain-containing protein [Planctomycetota bacterium]
MSAGISQRTSVQSGVIPSDRGDRLTPLGSSAGPSTRGRGVSVDWLSRREGRFWLAGILVGLAVLFVGSTYRTSWVGTAGLLLAGGWAFRSQRKKASQRVIGAIGGRHRRSGEMGSVDVVIRSRGRSALHVLGIVVVAGAVAGWRLAASPEGMGLRAFLDMLAHASAAILLLLWARNPRRGHIAMLPLGLILTMTCITAGGISSTTSSQISSGMLLCIAFCFAAAWVRGSRPPLVAAPLGDPSAQDAVSIDAKLDSLGKPELQMGALSWLLPATVLVIVTSIAGRVSEVSIPQIRATLQDNVSDPISAIDSRFQIGLGQYVSGGNLGSIRNELVQSPNSIALKADCAVRPGYLRGTVFHIYENGRWRQARRSRNAPSPIRTITPQGESGSQRSFSIGDPNDSRPTAEMRMYLQVERGAKVFTPLSVQELRGEASRIELSLDRIINPATLDVSRPFQLVAHAGGYKETLGPYERQKYLIVRSLRDLFSTYADNWRVPGASPREQAAAVARRFRQEFEYSLKPNKRPRDVDPVEHFLRTKHPGHCEFFAAATCHILRLYDIPTRYVTGYVMDTMDDEQDFWIARNRDAHAWVEAYDDRSGEWFVVESTPGQTYSTVNIKDKNDLSGAAGLSDAGDGEDGNSWWQILRRLVSGFRLGEEIFDSVRRFQVPLLIGLVAILLGRRYWQWRRTVDDEDRVAIARLRQVEQRIRRRFHLVRSDGETINQFAERLDEHRVPDAGRGATIPPSRFAGWLRDFASARYGGGALPDLESLRDDVPVNRTRS